MDSNDELLIDGYFRECNVTKVHLPSDIKKIIASYYAKLHSKSKLKELYETTKKHLTQSRQQRKQRRQQRKQNCIHCKTQYPSGHCNIVSYTVITTC